MTVVAVLTVAARTFELHVYDGSAARARSTESDSKASSRR
jgi:hypothetical protein